MLAEQLGGDAGYEPCRGQRRRNPVAAEAEWGVAWRRGELAELREQRGRRGRRS